MSALMVGSAPLHTMGAEAGAPNGRSPPWASELVGIATRHPTAASRPTGAQWAAAADSGAYASSSSGPSSSRHAARRALSTQDGALPVMVRGASDQDLALVGDLDMEEVEFPFASPCGSHTSAACSHNSVALSAGSSRFPDSLTLSAGGGGGG